MTVTERATKMTPSMSVREESPRGLPMPDVSSLARGLARPHAAAAIVSDDESAPLWIVSERPTCLSSESEENSRSIRPTPSELTLRLSTTIPSAL